MSTLRPDYLSSDNTDKDSNGSQGPGDHTEQVPKTAECSMRKMDYKSRSLIGLFVTGSQEPGTEIKAIGS